MDTSWFICSVLDTRLPIENYINVQITNDGYMWWYYPVTLKSSCLLNVKYFPFDQQACPLEFGSWTYDGSMVRFFPHRPPSPISIEQISSRLPCKNLFYFSFVLHFQINLINYTSEGDRSSLVHHGQWEVIGFPIRRYEIYYPCCKEPYPKITFWIVLRRYHRFP